jgi:hypothetical protein
MAEQTLGSFVTGLASLPIRFEQWIIKVNKIAINFFWLIYNWRWVFAIMIVLGIGMIQLRETILLFLPFMSKHLKLTQDLVSAMIDGIDVLKMITSHLMDMIDDTANLLGAHRTPPKYEPMKKPSLTEISSGLIEIAKICKPMNNGFKVTDFIMKECFNGLVCPAVRVLQPTVFGAVAHAATSWLIYSPDPTWPHSCEPLVPVNEMWVCATFGSGFVILEVIVPLIFMLLISYSFIKVAVSEDAPAESFLSINAVPDSFKKSKILETPF